MTTKQEHLNYKLLEFFIILIVTLSIVLYLVFENSIKKRANMFFTGVSINSENKTDDNTLVKLIDKDKDGSRKIVYTKFGELEANISIDSANIKDAPVYHGDTDEIFKKGLGQLTSGVYPAEPGKTIIYGYKSSCFKNLKDVKLKDKIEVTTPYGIFNYSVANIEVVDASTDKLAKTDKTKNTLVLCTNYPIGKVSKPDKWYAVYADFVDGTKVTIPKT